jgi:hypothetical protein
MSAPKISISVIGHIFEAPQPYREGHVCTLGESLVLNAALAENLRNNWARRLKTKIDKAKEEGRDRLNATELAYLRTDFALYASRYQFPTIRTSRQASDPIDRAAHKIAEDIVRTKLNERGIRLDDLSEEDAERHIARIMTLPQVREEAQRRVRASANIIAEAMEL